MQTIGDLFNIMLFVTFVGGAFTLAALAAGRILRFCLPPWFFVCWMAAYVVPLPAPGLYLAPPEPHSWVPGYGAVCAVWIFGITVLAVCDVARTALAAGAVRGCRVCGDERIKSVCARCLGLVSLRKMPAVRFGTLADPACAVGVLRPSVILNEAVMGQLTDAELTAVLCHELTHIKRGHMLLSRIFDYVCILNWMNPLAWVAKREFGTHCEIDCDRRSLTCLEDKMTAVDYADAMLRLLSLSALQDGKRAGGMSALGFPAAKRRIQLILRGPAKTIKLIAASVSVLLLMAIILFSVWLSRGHFYPYPARQSSPEYSSDCR